jgi:NAD(P)-dependent dehydrogenase (short-subunit alcohol dehydrogenase family)
MKLIRNGCTVIGTSRYPEKALTLYKEYPDYADWSDRLLFYDTGFDLDTDDLDSACLKLREFIESRFPALDILINSAAQTIRTKEKETFEINGENRYNDTKYVPNHKTNSWNMSLYEIPQKEMQEVYRVNCIGPTFVTKHMIPLMTRSTRVPYIINVHAREGLFNVRKSDKHFHTNMAKAGLAMLTKNLISMHLQTEQGTKFSIHGCDPGWISVDEYYEETRPWIVPPLDEIDGAVRILYPILEQLRESSWKTRRHFFQMAT